MSSSPRQRRSAYSDRNPGMHHSNRAISALGNRRALAAAVTRSKASNRKPGPTSPLRPPSQRGANVNRVGANAKALTAQANYLLKQSASLRAELLRTDFNLNKAHRNMAVMEARIHQLEQQLDISVEQRQQAKILTQQMLRQHQHKVTAAQMKSPQAYKTYLYALAMFVLTMYSFLTTVYIASAPRNNHNHRRILPPT